MKTDTKTVRVAVVQAAPILFDRERTVEKTADLVAAATPHRPQLILFPEAFIPVYPRGLDFGAVIGSRSASGRDQFREYLEQAVEVPGSTTRALGEIAKRARIYLAIGVTELDTDTRGTLYCTLLYFGPDGTLLGKHRKLKPTGTERIIWGEGDGSGLTVLDTEIGRIGGLICWENYMPLARMAMYNHGTQIYLAPTADARDTWQSTLVHIACEGRCFVLGCNQFVSREMVPANLLSGQTNGPPDMRCRGGSAVISPFGELLAGPVFDREEILYAELDLTEISRAKMDFDVSGHYQRSDVFELTVNGQPQPIPFPIVDK